MVRNRRVGCAAVSAASAALSVAVAQAQAVPDQTAQTQVAASTAAEQVVVTGQRVETHAATGTKSDTPLVETPQSITVISQQELDERVVENLNQALRFTAGIGPETRGNTAGRYDQLTLRGFTPDEYLDGLRLVGSANGYAVPQVDIGLLDRVEIVKGPASVLYGQGSPGGIVALSSKLPSFTDSGEMALTGGSYGTVHGTFDVGGVIDSASTLSYRFDAIGDRSDTETRLSEAQRYGFSPSISWRPDDKTQWTLLYFYQHDPEAGDYGAMPLQGTLLPNPNGRIPRDFYDGEPDYERFDREQSAITSLFSRQLDENWSFHQNFRYFYTSTSYRSVYHDGFAPGDLTTIERNVAAADEGAGSYTLDNQLIGKFDTGALHHSVVAGVDYQNTHQTEFAGFGCCASPLNVFDPVYGAPVTTPAASFQARFDLDQVGLYAQDQLAWNGFRLVLSGREDWVDGDQLDLVSHADSTLSQSKFTYRAGLLYLFDNGMAPYLSYSTSFEPQLSTDKSGNILPPTLGKQTEIGLKYQPGAWDSLFTLAGYDLKETNVATGDPSTNGLTSIAAGEVESLGIEFEGAAHPFPGLDLRGSYTYLQNTVTEDDSGQIGAHPYGVPRETGSIFGTYTFQDGPAAGFGLGAGLRYIGRSYNGVAATPGNPALTVPDTTLVDLLASYDLSKLGLRGVSANLDVTNLFDRRYISSCYSTIWCWYGPGMDAEATLRYRW